MVLEDFGLNDYVELTTQQQKRIIGRGSYTGDPFAACFSSPSKKCLHPGKICKEEPSWTEEGGHPRLDVYHCVESEGMFMDFECICAYSYTVPFPWK